MQVGHLGGVRLVLNNSTAVVQNTVVKRDGKYFVVSAEGDKDLAGPFDTETEAQDRLGEIEFFKDNPETNMQQPMFNSIALNLSKPKIRHDTLEGRPHLVVPMVMITEGVFNGSNGPLFYPRAELAKTPASWNHKPIVVYHPQINGVGVSACDPEILSNRKIGVILNARFDGRRLLAEAWLEADRIAKIDDRILEALEAGRMIELSTGLFTDNEASEGEFKGRRYVAIARNYRPDHLAILPDQKGACSIEDGAGLLRLNQMSHEDLRMMLHDSFLAFFGPDDDWFIEAVFDNHVIFSRGGKLFKHDFTVEEGEIKIEEPAERVVRVTEFRTPDGEPVGNLKEMFSMNKKKFVDGLITNGSWTEEDREFLMGLSEDRLQKLAKPVENKTEQNADPTPAPAPAPAPAQNTQEMDPVAYINNAPPAIRDMLMDSVRTTATLRTKMIAEIVANERNVITEERLKEMNITDLRGVHALVQSAPAAVAQPQVHNFQGLAEAFSQNPGNPTDNAGEEEPMALPVMEFGA